MAFIKQNIKMLKGSDNVTLESEIIGKKVNFAHTGGKGAVTSVTITNGGLLSAVPTLTTTGNGSGASFTPILAAQGFVITGLGTGYSVNDVLTLSGGTSTLTAQVTVNTVNGSGGVTSATLTRAGTYTAIPTGFLSFTGGTGSGFQVGMTWLLASVTVNSGGSGYDGGSALVITGANTFPAAANLVINNLGVALTIPVTSFPNLPNSYGVWVNPGQDCRYYVPPTSKTNSGFNVILTPSSNTVAIVPGSIDILVDA